MRTRDSCSFSRGLICRRRSRHPVPIYRTWIARREPWSVRQSRPIRCRSREATRSSALRALRRRRRRRPTRLRSLNRSQRQTSVRRWRCPTRRRAPSPRVSSSRSRAVHRLVIADAIRNVQKARARDRRQRAGWRGSGLQPAFSSTRRCRIRSLAAAVHRADSPELVHPGIRDVPEGACSSPSCRRTGASRN